MGTCQSKSNNNNQNRAFQKEQQININETNPKNNRVNECIVSPLEGFENFEPHLSKVSRSICRLEIITKLGIIKGTGFFLKFDIGQNKFNCLISNEHVITSDIINNSYNIDISYDYLYKSIKIQLDTKKRYIKGFQNKGLDITIVEMIKDDKINEDYFLEPELEERINRNLTNSRIYIPQYPNGDKLKNARGQIKEINKYEFTHLANTYYGSSGSPVFLEKSIKVIGIHKQGNIEKNENYADFIYPVIKLINEEKGNIKNNSIYILRKNIYEDGKYYKGELKNNLPNGKGTLYYPNGYVNY